MGGISRQAACRYAVTYKPRYFSPSELRCKCSKCGLAGYEHIDPKVLELADEIRAACNFPLRINSSVRCRLHNVAVGGAPRSYHLAGKALDLSPIPATNQRLAVLQDAADHFNPCGGVIFYESFVHVDVRGSRYRAGDKWVERDGVYRREHIGGATLKDIGAGHGLLRNNWTRPVGGE